MKNDLISIIMPAFEIEKHTKLFEESISGIFAQTYSNFELLIVLDGPNKKTKDVIKNVISKYDKNKIKIFEIEKRIGPGLARNTIIRYAKGKYLTFHDTDDFSLPNRFEKLIETIGDDDIVFSNITIKEMFIKGKMQSRNKGYCNKDLVTMLLQNNKAKPFFHFPSCLITKSFFEKIGGFEPYRFSSDSLIAIKIGYYRQLIEKKDIPIISDFLFVWNRHPHSVTTKDENSKKLRRCQRAQREGLINDFRNFLLTLDLAKDNSVEIFNALFKNNLIVARKAVKIKL